MKKVPRLHLVHLHVRVSKCEVSFLGDYIKNLSLLPFRGLCPGPERIFETNVLKLQLNFAARPAYSFKFKP